MRSFLKIFGPPVLKAIKALEMVAVEMPEVCIMDMIMLKEMPSHLARELDVSGTKTRSPTPRGQFPGNWALNYFKSSNVTVPLERCQSIISDAGESLGDYDFFFEWFQEPSMEQMFDLIGRIDEALTPLGCHYTITSR